MNVARWWLNPTPRIYTAILFVILGVACFVVGLTLGTESGQIGGTRSQLTRDELNTCRIQARGLPASKHLSRAMLDISELLSLKPASAVPPYVEGLLQNLRNNSAAYAQIEAKQPKSRSCGA